MPLLRIAMAMILGMVVCHELGGLMWYEVTEGGVLTGRLLVKGCLCLLLVSLGVAWLCRSRAVVQSVALLMGAFFMGGCLMAMAESRMDAEVPVEEQLYKAVLVSEPMERGKVVRCDLMLTTGSLAGRKVKASILKDTVARNYLRLHVGDGIIASSIMEQPEEKGSVANSYTHFNYGAYLRSNGFVATTFIFWSSWQKAVVDLSSLSLLQRTRLAALRVRQRILDRVGTMGMEEQDYAVVAAMTLGEKSKLSRDTREEYARSGASHVLALSGLHLGIIYMMLSLLIGYRRHRLLGECVLLLSIWAYVFIVGLPASAVRAAIMLTLYGLVGLGNRDKMSLNTLSFAAILMLVVNPMLLYDVGFQLSFLSVAGIVVCYRPFYELLPLSWRHYYIIRYVWGMLVVSLCAQLATAPLVAYYFGRFACYGLLTNFVVIPLATVILWLAALLLVCFPLGFLRMLVAKALVWVAGLLNGTMAWIASLPGASVEGISISRLQVMLLYVAVGCFLAAAIVCSNSFSRKRGV